MRNGGQVSGLVSLLTIFCALSLCVFAILTLSSAERERRFTELNVQRAASYYEANRKAVEYVASLDPAEVPEQGTAVFTVPDGEELTLRVELRNQNGKLEILRWQTLYSGNWEPEEYIEVWSGYESAA